MTLFRSLTLSLLLFLLLALPLPGLAQVQISPERNLGAGFRSKTVTIEGQTVVLVHFPRRCYLDTSRGPQPAQAKVFVKCAVEGFTRQFGRKAVKSDFTVDPITEDGEGPMVGVIFQRKGLLRK